MGWVGDDNVCLCECCKVCVNEVVDCVGQRGGVVVDVISGIHGMKRSAGRRVHEEDRHHRRVLVTVELSFVLCKNTTKRSFSFVHVATCSVK